MKYNPTDFQHKFIKWLAREAFKYFKKLNISEDGDATVLGVILLDPINTKTFKIWKRTWKRRRQRYSKKS